MNSPTVSGTRAEARMANPVQILPEALKALYALHAASSQSGIPHSTLELVHLRASQINGCGFCVLMHSRDLQKSGESFDKIQSVAAWRESSKFTDAERAALALTEAGTRLADTAEAVSDEVFAEAARHFSERELADLVLQIAQINLWNRINVLIRNPAGD